MKWLGKLIKYLLILGILAGLSGVIALGAAYYYIEPELPDVEALREVQLQVPLKVFAADGELIAEFGEKRRTPLSFGQYPERLVQAFISAEDANFFTHPGVDIRGLARAGVKLLLTGERRQGGSTITMQVARNYYLSRKKTFLRKLREIFLALRIEETISKPEILELYLNKIYLGHRAYGVAAAAQVYYGKPLDELSLPQLAMIAGLPKAPSALNPLTDPERAVLRRNYVLGRMLELNYITDEEHRKASSEPLSAQRYAPKIGVEAPYVAEMVRTDMIRRFGADAYTGGYRVYTTIAGRLQSAANDALRKALEDYDERHGYRGPEARLDPAPSTVEQQDAALADYTPVVNLRPGLVTAVEEKSASVYLGDGNHIIIDWDGMKWARQYESTNRRGATPKKATDILVPGDIVRVKARQDDEGNNTWRLSQVPAVEGALISLKADDGAILAIIGGYNYFSSKFNRVTQAARQPGSGFKPFLYSAALEKGYTAASIINDAPVVFDDPGLEGAWRPENYSGKFFGPTRLRFALTKSRNLVSIRLLRDIGVDYAIEYAKRFGFEPKQLPRNLSLSLGSVSLAPIEMARGYAVLANGGFLVEPYVISRIEQNEDSIVYQAKPALACDACPETQEVNSDPLAQTALEQAEAQPSDVATEAAGAVDAPRYAPRVITPQNRYLMYSMMQDVVRRGTATKARELGRQDIAGKTGTTNDQRDAWFNGYNQSIVTNVWVGFDNNEQLGRGEVGGRAALPAWIDYMAVALDGTPDRSPDMPAGMVTVRIDERTGKRSAAGAENTMFEVFREEYVPDSAPAAIVTPFSQPEPGTGGSPVPGDLF